MHFTEVKQNLAQRSSNYILNSQNQYSAYTRLKITPVWLSRTSRFSARASNLVFLLAARARAQASRSPMKFLIMILRRKDKF